MVQYGMGTLYAVKGQLEEAISHFKKAVDLFPYFAEAYYNLGVAYKKKLDISNMAKSLEKAIRMSDSKNILYGQDTALAEISPVMAELSLWIDHKLFILEDGYAGWVKNGGPIQSEKIRTKIVYLPKPGPGEIVGDEFMNIVNSESEDKVVLDVRSAAETADGKIEWAINIPLDDLQSRMSDLPKDKEIIIHCGSGMRALMAYNALQNAGYQSRFLADKVAFIEKKPICCFKE